MKSARASWRGSVPYIAVASVAMIMFSTAGGGERPASRPESPSAASKQGSRPAQASGKGSRATSAPGSLGQTQGPASVGSGAPIPPVTLPVLPPGSQQVRTLTTGSRILKPGSSVQTDSIHPRPGGSVLVWVFGATPGDDPSPVPTVSGAGLGSFRLVDTVSKKPNAPRRLSLFAANVPSRPPSGPLTIDFGSELHSSQWTWAVNQVVARRTVRQTATEGGGNWETEYTVNYDRPTVRNNVALAGFLIGRGDQDPVATPPMREVTVAEGVSPAITIFVTWTTERVSSAHCRWQRPGHSEAVAVEMAA